MAQLSRLFFREEVDFDRQRMTDLVHARGMRAAEALLTQAMEDLAHGMGALEQAYAAADFRRMGRESRRLAACTEAVGLVSVERSALDLARLSDAGDGAAIAAVLCRLIRMGEASLVSVWEAGDLVK